MKWKLQVSNLWLVFTGTRLTYIKVASFEEVGFHFPRCSHGTKLGVGNPNLDDIQTSKHKNKIVHHAPPKNDHDGRWLSRKNSCLLFSKWEMFLLLDMGIFILLSLMVVLCLWHTKWQLGSSLISLVLTLCLCWQVQRRKELGFMHSSSCVFFLYAHFHVHTLYAYYHLEKYCICLCVFIGMMLLVEKLHFVTCFVQLKMLFAIIVVSKLVTNDNFNYIKQVANNIFFYYCVKQHLSLYVCCHNHTLYACWCHPKHHVSLYVCRCHECMKKSWILILWMGSLYTHWRIPNL